MNKLQDRWVALSVVFASLGLGLVLLIGIGAVKTPTVMREVRIDFARIDNIKANVTEIKYGGVPVGKVTEVRILDKAEREQLRSENKPDCLVRVTGRVQQDLALPPSTRASVRQASLMSEHFVELEPGALSGEMLALDAIIPGDSPAGLGDLVAPGSDILGDAKKLMAGITARMPEVLGNVNKLLLSAQGAATNLSPVLGKADLLMATLSSDDSRENIRKSLTNVRVATDNLKVVSTHAKLLTATLAQRPWRVLFGGKANALPDEGKVISSDKAYPVKPTEGADQ